MVYLELRKALALSCHLFFNFWPNVFTLKPCRRVIVTGKENIYSQATAAELIILHPTARLRAGGNHE